MHGRTNEGSLTHCAVGENSRRPMTGRSHVLRSTAASIVEHEEAPLVRINDLRRNKLVSENGRQSRLRNSGEGRHSARSSRHAPRVRPRVPPTWSHSSCRRRDTRSDDRASFRDGSAGRRSASRGLPSQRVCTSRTSSRCESRGCVNAPHSASRRSAISTVAERTDVAHAVS